MDKLLTIVVPTYNMESLLPRCLDSLVKPQCSQLLEVLVVNDGSKDNSLAVAKEYENKYPGIIKAVDKENGNYGSAVNKGIELASGKYFRILDADDFYENQGLMNLLDKLSTLDVDMILTNFRRDRGNEKTYYCSQKSKCNIVSPFEKICIREFPNFKMHAITYKTSILKENNIHLQTGISYTDSEYCFYPLSYIESFIALDILVYCYQLGRVGQTVDISSQIKSVRNMVQISNRMYKHLKNTPSESRVFDQQCEVYCDVNSLCFLTVLCCDKSNENIYILDDLLREVQDIPEADNIMMKKHLFGVKYYKRYVCTKKTSNGSMYRFYYWLVKRLAPLYHLFKGINKL